MLGETSGSPLHPVWLVLASLAGLMLGSFLNVVAHRLRDEYKVECQFETVNVATARWVECDDAKMLADFRRKAEDNLALDHGERLVYIAPTRVNLGLTEERWPDVEFRKTREH